MNLTPYDVFYNEQFAIKKRRCFHNDAFIVSGRLFSLYSFVSIPCT